jgi:hypothetical protein
MDWDFGEASTLHEVSKDERDQLGAGDGEGGNQDDTAAFQRRSEGPLDLILDRFAAVTLVSVGGFQDQDVTLRKAVGI